MELALEGLLFISNIFLLLIFWQMRLHYKAIAEQNLKFGDFGQNVEKMVKTLGSIEHEISGFSEKTNSLSSIKYNVQNIHLYLATIKDGLKDLMDRSQ